ncbi:hypothetical protein PV729_07745 [Streptomyces europaeiscabiei]|uniref:Uncharacterized protein n=1 Tax=Streptomyces europaeiscabiei TaxID=146819 RepID=A0ABU4NA06_9ACTN|nr:hypothetical protein [Streptomyces europaeiscabiei]MDX3541323.1 hypothetical protein [Streptomyces europaeiscabiei]MDX3551664.1 hypothetical protein [Streptomyces europaeiscabiei]MDX3699903.1 hypothetical protein [Streptomyces europaeiscabiei]
MDEFLFQASKDPRVKTRLQEELDNLDEAQQGRMRELQRLGGHAFIVADISDLEGEEAYALAEVHRA